MSDFERVKQGAPLKEYAAARLQKRRGRFICPFCNSGGRGTPGSDSGFSITGDMFKCFSCDETGDIFDLAAAVEEIDPNDKRAQLERVAAWANVTITAAPQKPETPLKRKTETKPFPDYAQGREKERAYILKAQRDIAAPAAVAYLDKRGYTLEQARVLGFGYDAQRQRIILPWKGYDYYHTDRAIDETTNPKYMKPKSDEVGAQPLYNPEALEAPAFYVCEGVLDAIAIQLTGFQAVALGGVGTSELIKALQGKPRKATALLLLDNDPAGEQAREKAALAFDEAHLPYKIIQAPAEIEGKDPAEMRQWDSEAFRAFLSRVYTETEHGIKEEEEKAYKDALECLRVFSPTDIASNLFMMDNLQEPIPTGFKRFDEETSGGLPIGLCVLGAVSSLGKTTLALQIADQIAVQGVPVLFVTIEQGAGELVAKSLSRYMHALPNGQYLSATAAEILNPKRRNEWEDDKTAHLLEACGAYNRDVSEHLHILEGMEQPSVEDIAEVARHIRRHDGKAPVIFIDYLQLLRYQNERDTEKQTTDKNVMSLRQLARDLQTPIVAISSLNRSSYSGVISLDSFKESGAIEYGADLLLSLQPEQMGESMEGEGNPKKQADKILRKHKGYEKRPCEIVILKQRNGATPEQGIPVVFDTLHSTFTDA